MPHGRSTHERSPSARRNRSDGRSRVDAFRKLNLHRCGLGRWHAVSFVDAQRLGSGAFLSLAGHTQTRSLKLGVEIRVRPCSESLLEQLDVARSSERVGDARH